LSEIVERFRRIHRDTPDRPLIHLPVTRACFTAEDVLAASEEHRRALNRLALGQDNLVILAIGNRPAAFPFWLACRAAGIAVMPVDVGATTVEIADLARRFGATVVILPGQADPPPSLGEPAAFCDGLLAIRVSGVEPRPDLYRGAAALKLTSGSTGLPKATFTTDAELVIDSDQILGAMDIRPDHTQIAAIPLSHAYGLGNLLVPVLTRGTGVILREGFVPHSLIGDARTYGADAFPGVPFMFEHLAGSPPADGWPCKLQKLVSAGARLEPSTVRRFFDAFGVKIHSFYGTSETGGIAYDDGDELEEETTVGRQIPGVSITLKPEEGAPPDGGRVHVAGKAVAARYVGERPADGSFVDGGFLTGDFGRFDASGHLVLTGRVSAFINVAGRKVQPEEVEQVLRAMPSIADVRVLGAPDAARGQQIVACIVPRDGERNVLAVRQYCAARLAVYKVPRQIVWLDGIPLTARGKTDRARLEALVRDLLAP
jgi:acyl-CoA synthetase (AMP-forming)/AMP-acid ligase II